MYKSVYISIPALQSLYVLTYGKYVDMWEMFMYVFDFSKLNLISLCP